MYAALQDQCGEDLEIGPEPEDGQQLDGPAREHSPVCLVSRVNLFPDLLHHVFEKIVLGARRCLTASGHDLLFCVTQLPGADDEQRRAAVLRRIEQGVEGFIAWNIASRDPECVTILDSGLPAIFIDTDMLAPHAGSVLAENIDGMAKAVAHLYESGRRRIAHISGHFETRPGTDRLFGFRAEIGELALELPPGYVVNGDFTLESGYAAMQQLLALPQPPDAVACANDSMAVGAMKAIEEAGLRIPDDIAVTGFDDAEFATGLVPSLTTVRQDGLSTGTAAAEALLQMLADPDCAPPVIVIETELVVRESSGSAKS
ncbi:MAG: substrate-binding domain-containing protein [Gaiellaceae bacterium]|jgi:LacI family transcriptional regulator